MLHKHDLQSIEHIMHNSNRSCDLAKQRWSTIMERVAADPWVRKRVMFDILNEPDARFMHVSEASEQSACAHSAA